ncbi:uncharacterized protein LOC141852849 [Brevipalpus obovatus]|uniref:uncharacterized protein LOC141852849 n=1 Tax=Brevipalpus obovatus TaxID=246614 RepID=UPI003D9EDD73
MMHQALKVDVILERIFSFLRAKDLKSVRQVCQKWRLVASHVLTIRPSTMYCLRIMEQANGSEYMGVLYNGDKSESVRLRSSRNLVKKFDEFVIMRRVNNPIFSLTFGKYWDMRYVVPPKDFPGVVLGIQGVIFQRNLNQLERTINDHVTSDDGIASILVSKCQSDLTVTITDWDDPKSPLPKVKDISKPLKGMFIFAKNPSTLWNGESILNFLAKVKGLRDKIMITGSCVNIAYSKREPRRTVLRESNLLSIAFSGKGVELAKLVFLPKEPEQIQKEVNNFRKSLNFDPESEQSQTYGFIFDLSPSKPVKDYFHIVQSIFPKVNFIGCTFCTYLFRWIIGNANYVKKYEAEYNYEDHCKLDKLKKVLAASEIDPLWAEDFTYCRETTIFLVHTNRDGSQ